MIDLFDDSFPALLAAELLRILRTEYTEGPGEELWVDLDSIVKNMSESLEVDGCFYELAIRYGKMVDEEERKKYAFNKSCSLIVYNRYVDLHFLAGQFFHELVTADERE